MVMVAYAQSEGKIAHIEFLRLNPFFAGLDDGVLEKIARLSVVRMVDKQEIIWLEQAPAKMIYFVASGLVKLFLTSPAGREQILRLVRPGDCFGHAGAFNGGSNPESAQAVVPSLLYGISRTDLQALLDEHPQLALNIITVLTTEMHHYMSLVEDLSLRSVSERLARMLLAYSSKGVCNTSRVLTRTDMAAMTGTVREVVGKSLKALEEKGVISCDGHNIIIRDSLALRALASAP
jgi:CRP-like cAMP-binding protein